MLVQHKVILNDTTGAAQSPVFTDWESLTYTRQNNGAGPYILQIGGDQFAEQDASALRSLFDLDYQVEVWRRIPESGLDWYLEYEGFHRQPRIWRDENGWHFQSKGYEYPHLLWRRIIAQAAGSDESTKSDKAETVIKEYVDENAGPGAGARAFSGLTIEADGAGGNTWSGTGIGKNLLEQCQTIARTGGGDFDIVGTGAATFEFRWYDGQRGTDRTGSVLFAVNYDNMGDPYLEEIDGGANAVWVVGQGQGETRQSQWVTDATAMALSPWNRIEAHRDARDTNDTDVHAERGNEIIEQNRARKELGYSVIQTPSRCYGVHYFLGDLFKTRFLSYEVDRKLVSVTVTVDRDNNEELIMETEDAE